MLVVGRRARFVGIAFTLEHCLIYLSQAVEGYSRELLKDLSHGCWWWTVVGGSWIVLTL